MIPYHSYFKVAFKVFIRNYGSELCTEVSVLLQNPEQRGCMTAWCFVHQDPAAGLDSAAVYMLL